jgi:glycogen debranching enzyme
LLGELSRWGIPESDIQALLPSADRALDWISEFGDRDGDGFVEYARTSDQGLRNQGWKDSWDGVNFADGSLAEPPIALCEVQGYVYAAYLARAEIAAVIGDQATEVRWADRAAQLKEQFNDRFWMPDRGYYAIALDRHKRQVDACASNMGHCLWSGIVDRDKAGPVAERLLSPDMFSGWGVRTLATSMGAYNPASYHNGSVWPHDNALIAAGLMRYGFVEYAQRVAVGLFDAAERFNGRLPELFCGFPRAQYRDPIPYPTSCSPQAWAAATPIQLVRTLLRFDPHISRGQLFLAPALPAGFGRLQVRHAPVADDRVDIDVTGQAVTVHGLPDAVRLIQQPAPPPDVTPPRPTPSGG